eukprot:jgi/Botrbrau1/12696/Bobra.67_1s0060.1
MGRFTCFGLLSNIRWRRGRNRMTSSRGADCSMAGCIGWNDLPEDLQRKILLDFSLSFPELALVAPTCKFFHQVYLERARQMILADELLLNDAVNAATSSDAIDSALSYLIGPRPANPPSGQHVSRFVRVPPGAPWPDSSTLHLENFTLVICPRHGALPHLLWGLQRFSDCHLITLFIGGPSTVVNVLVRGMSHVEFSISAGKPSHVAPCLALTYHVCKRLERETGRLPSVAVVPRRLAGELPHDKDPQAGDREMEEAKPALAAFHRWCYRIGSRIPSFAWLH